MMAGKPCQEIVNTVLQILGQVDSLPAFDLSGKADEILWQPFTGDGSNRRFWRVLCGDQGSCIVVAPERCDEMGLQEAYAAWHIGNHLHDRGVPVPELYGYDRSTGVLVCEDLGNTKLHDLACVAGFDNRVSGERLLARYRQAVSALADMQCRGKVGFDRRWCCDTACYDKKLMLERESGYFLQAFWQGILGKPIPPGIIEEFQLLAERAASAPGGYFLYRDFQSRNIMIHNDEVRFIDYQGGRLGPLGYDLASLLIDPYVQLPDWFQREVYAFYVAEISRHVPVDQAEFHRQYVSLALQRNLQIIGAFAFLSKIRGKMFFADYIYPALCSLRKGIENAGVSDYEVLATMADVSLTRFSIA